MCQMCEEYEAELRRMGIAVEHEIKITVADEVMDELSRRAEAHGHDIEHEVGAIVRDTVAHPQRITAEESIRRARAIRAMSPKGAIQTDSTQLIREDRDSR